MNVIWSEVFRSLQGEGEWLGQPSIFVRLFGCNFTCDGFDQQNVPEEQRKTRDLIAKDIDSYKTIDDIPVANVGCDSFVSWDKRFRKFNTQGTLEDFHQEIEGTLDEETAIRGIPQFSGIHLVVTGGEPLLKKQQKMLIELLPRLQKKNGLQDVTFETNGTQKLIPEFTEFLKETELSVTFAVSPKLSCSGHTREEAIHPEIVREYAQNSDKTFLKFVVDAETAGSKEFLSIFVEYLMHGIAPHDIFLMPVGGNAETYRENAKAVADLCVAQRYRYTPRLQVDLWKNEWGT